ncbi:hypothetical protein [Streptomyces sp. 029-5]|uniref:hypothetical protein n=1 Tax=Streptomyces sp. 029-5 TaxID=2789261 RepID=UPI00398130DA
MHEAGHDVSLPARSERLTALRRRGVRLANSSLPLPVPCLCGRPLSDPGRRQPHHARRESIT